MVVPEKTAASVKTVFLQMYLISHMPRPVSLVLAVLKAWSAMVSYKPDPAYFEVSPDRMVGTGYLISLTPDV